MKHNLEPNEQKRAKPPRAGMKRSRVNPVSDRQREKNASRVAPRDAQLEKYNYCEARQAGAPFDCFGILTVHEPWTRARGGPIDDPRNMATLCVRCNTHVSQHPVMMRWAYEKGMLVHAQDGPDWLEAGGVSERRKTWNRRTVRKGDRK